MYSESAFKVDYEQLNGDIQLFRNIPGVPLGSTSKTIINWIGFSNRNKQKNIFFRTLFSYEFFFRTIPVTRCSRATRVIKVYLIIDKNRNRNCTEMEYRKNEGTTIIIE